MSNLGSWGKTHVLLPCVSPSLLFVTLFVSSNLVNLFNAQLVVEELWLRAFIAEVVVVVGGCQPYPIAHSTHIAHSSPSRTPPWSVHSTTILVCWLLMQGLWAFLVSRRFSCSSPRVAEHPRTANLRPSCCVCIHGQKRSCFSSRRASNVCYFPYWVGLFTHA